jgi:hypothetical protein
MYIGFIRFHQNFSWNNLRVSNGVLEFRNHILFILVQSALKSIKNHVDTQIVRNK